MTVRTEPTAVITGNVVFGDDCYVGNYTTIAAAREIRIGNRTAIAAGCWIGDQDHDLEGPDIHACGVVEPVVIGERCWIGANAVILKGVQLGDDCVVGAGAVVTKSFPAGSVIVGNPARLLRHRERAA